MSCKNTHTQSAFTLLQVLFFIAVISAMVGMMVGFMQQRAITNKVERTALLTQSWTAAVMNYYNQNNHLFPADNNCDADCMITNGYMPKGTSKNAWGAPFVFTTGASSGRSVMRLSSDVPTSIPNAKRLAKRVAALLPANPVIDNTVSVNVPAPALSTLFRHGAVIAIRAINFHKLQIGSGLPNNLDCSRYPRWVPKVRYMIRGFVLPEISDARGAPKPNSVVAQVQAIAQFPFIPFNGIQTTSRIEHKDVTGRKGSLRTYSGQVLAIYTCEEKEPQHYRPPPFVIH